MPPLPHTPTHLSLVVLPRLPGPLEPVRSCGLRLHCGLQNRRRRQHAITPPRLFALAPCRFSLEQGSGAACVSCCRCTVILGRLLLDLLLLRRRWLLLLPLERLPECRG